jgi:hypothetical protein
LTMDDPLVWVLCVWEANNSSSKKSGMLRNPTYAIGNRLIFWHDYTTKQARDLELKKPEVPITWVH